MNTLRFLRRLIRYLSDSEAVEGRKLICNPEAKLPSGIRAQIGLKGHDIWPIVLLYNPNQTPEEVIEALAWAVGHIALGHLKNPKGGWTTLTVATLKSYLPNLGMTDEWLLRKARTELSLKAFLWAALLLVDPKRYQELRKDKPIPEVRRILSRELSVPLRLIKLWERCQRFPPTSLEEVLGRPRDWANEVIVKAAIPRKSRNQSKTRSRLRLLH